jgi:hypothetical protein
MPFITLLDDRARPKGSRDPLGFELVWTHFGRKVVGNLTTITSSLENFTVALLGFHWANELAVNVPKDEKQKTVRGYFLRFEQVAAYLRYQQKSKTIMGINRVSQRVRDERNKYLPIGIESEKQILSDQASYGLWGLYSAAMRDTGLIVGAERDLTEAGMQIALKLESMLDKSAIIKLLQQESVSKQTLEHYSKGFMNAIKDPIISQILLESLLAGSGSHMLQIDLWDNTRQLIEKGVLPNKKYELIKLLSETDISSDLRVELHRIEKIERVLVALNNIFNYCRTQHGVMFADVIKNIEKQNYDFSYLPEDLNDFEFPHNKMINTALLAMKSKDYTTVILQVLALNKKVMKQRKGAPWVDVESGKKINVAMKSETTSLLSIEKLQKNWDYDYFLGSFLQMAHSYNDAQGDEVYTNG